MAATPLIAIVGRPNVGKSSLFNRLVGRRQAITHDAAGTTRDANYGGVEWSGKYMMLVDTAGLGKGEDELELRVQEQVREVAGLADVLVVVADAGAMITNEDRDATRLALRTGKPVVLALNKIDTAAKGLADSFERLGVKQVIETSAVHGRGTGDLLDAINQHIEAANAPEETNEITLAILGRPNVGKSSLLNSMVGKQKAVVSGVAGTTRDINSEVIKYHGQSIRLLDTAGLRRRGKIESGVERYSALRTLAAIAQADIAIIVMDATEPSVAGDQHIAGQAIDAGKGLILAINKWDAVEEKDDKTQDRFTRRLMHDFAFAPWAPLVFTSATQGQNVTKIFELVRGIAERRTTQIATGEFNRVIERLTAAQPPAGLKGRQPKIKYATQTGINPPTFGIHSSYPELVHFSYQRYLENGLRGEYNFTGTPIKLEFKGK